jgi:hypothetical protein
MRSARSLHLEGVLISYALVVAGILAAVIRDWVAVGVCALCLVCALVGVRATYKQMREQP